MDFIFTNALFTLWRTWNLFLKATRKLDGVIVSVLWNNTRDISLSCIKIKTILANIFDGRFESRVTEVVIIPRWRRSSKLFFLSLLEIRGCCISSRAGRISVIFHEVTARIKVLRFCSNLIQFVRTIFILFRSISKKTENRFTCPDKFIGFVKKVLELRYPCQEQN